MALSVLSVLINRQVHRLYAPSLDVAGAHVAGPSFSVPISDQIGDAWVHRFVNLKAIWSETPRFMNDYWELQASDDQTPMLIVLWHEQHPTAHEQKVIEFRAVQPLAQLVPLFSANVGKSGRS